MKTKSEPQSVGGTALDQTDLERGKIFLNSYAPALCYVSWDVRRLKQPEIPAVIEIDGASRGMGILHLISKVAPRDVHVGMRVTAVWRTASKRTGSITDIAYWMPSVDPP